MWLPDRRLVALGLLAVAGGCGFQPLYGEGSGTRGSVALDGVSGREGYFFADRFRRRMGDAGPDSPYLVTVTLRLESEGFGITRDDDITRFDIRGTAAYALRRRGEAQSVSEGEVSAVSSYDTTASPYATRVAQRDAERRVAAELAERLFARLAAQRLDSPA